MLIAGTLVWDVGAGRTLDANDAVNWWSDLVGTTASLTTQGDGTAILNAGNNYQESTIISARLKTTGTPLTLGDLTSDKDLSSVFTTARGGASDASADTNQLFQHGSDLSDWADVPVVAGGSVTIQPDTPQGDTDTVAKEPNPGWSVASR